MNLEHHPPHFSPEQRANLIKLADYLEAVYVTTSRRPLNSEFSMTSFMQAKNTPSLVRPGEYTTLEIFTPNRYYSLPESCNTVCCAVGHGPLAGIRGEVDELWLHYAHRVFGAGSPSVETVTSDVEYYSSKQAYDWLFSGLWTEVDNTPLGAVKRIRYALKNGIPVIRSFMFDIDNQMHEWYNEHITNKEYPR